MSSQIFKEWSCKKIVIEIMNELWMECCKTMNEVVKQVVTEIMNEILLIKFFLTCEWGWGVLRVTILGDDPTEGQFRGTCKSGLPQWGGWHKWVKCGRKK